MHVLIVHNKYKSRGGEDRVVESQLDLLRRMGHTVGTVIVDNGNIEGVQSRAAAAVSAVYSLSARKLVRREIIRARPAIAHVHNTFPLLSPSVFDELNKHGIPSVATLHNFRTVCPTGTLYHNGRIVERSISGSAWWVVPARAYRHSLSQSAAITVAVEIHRRLGTWWRGPSRLTVLTQHAKEIFVKAGYPESTMSVLPNFTTPGMSPEKGVRFGALFVGRLSGEKGVELLIDAWRDIDYPLVVAGSGPLGSMLRASAPAHVTFVGAQDEQEVAELMSSSLFLVLPSMWFEMFPMTLLEAFAASLPVLASDIGSLGEIIVDGKTGLLFSHQSRESLIACAKRLIGDPALCRSLGRAGKMEWQTKYSPDVGYSNLIKLYREVIGKGAPGSRSSGRYSILSCIVYSALRLVRPHKRNRWYFVGPKERREVSLRPDPVRHS